MFFLNHAKDTPLYQELVRESVITAALWDSLPLPAEGHIMDVLIGHASKVSEKAWIDWLIRKHDCTRIGSLLPDYDFIKKLDRQLISECIKYDCYPLQPGNNHLFVGIGRPDYPEFPAKLAAVFNKSITYHNALTLNELSDLRALCTQSLQTM